MFRKSITTSWLVSGLVLIVTGCDGGLTGGVDVPIGSPDIRIEQGDVIVQLDQTQNNDQGVDVDQDQDTDVDQDQETDVDQNQETDLVQGQDTVVEQNQGDVRDGQEVVICHIPAGDPDNAQTISIAESALLTHLRNGDTFGPCDDCDDDDPCTVDTVDRDTGDCIYTEVICDDGLFCNGQEACDADTGECIDGESPCADGEACDEDADACVILDCQDDGDCDDGLFCNGRETCDPNAGECLDSEDPCTEGQVCDEEIDDCGASWVLRQTGGPPARLIHDMVYDEAREIVLLYGGSDGSSGSSYFGDTWGWDGTVWDLLAASSSGPPARYQSTIAYDSQRERVVLFGGYREGTLGDTWEWNGFEWAQHVVSGPSPRHSHGMAYDVARGMTVVYGGDDISGGEDLWTWGWDGNSWQVLATAGPDARSYFEMAYDEARESIVLFGGNKANSHDVLFGDTWIWDGFAWTKSDATGPSPRTSYTMTYDAAREVIVLFGGATTVGAGTTSGETWEWNGSVWNEQHVSGPAARDRHAAAYDRRRAATVLFGGRLDAYIGNQETWEYRGND